MDHSEALPEYISHYTSVAGFLGIVQSRGFHASHIRQMNDRAETEPGMGHIVGPLQDLDWNLAAMVWKLHKREHYFVSSFSGDTDSMVLWDRYKAEIEMRFNTVELLNGIREYSGLQVDLQKVTYDDDEFVGRVDAVRAANPTELGGLSEIGSLVASHKDSAWLGEAEYRFVLRLDPDNRPVHAALLKFKPGRYGITPYVELAFGSKCAPIPFSMLNWIRVGPSHHQEEIVNAVEVLAFQHGRADMRGDYWRIEPSIRPLRLP